MIDRAEAARKAALTVARLSGLSSIAGRFMGGLGAIMMLHRVSRAAAKPLGLNRHLTICPDFLDALLAEMARGGYRFVTMDEAVERVRSGHTGELFATFTADDAYRDNLTEALPVLEKHGAPIAIYVAPALTDGGVDLWWDVLEDIVTASDRLSLATPDGSIAIDCSTLAKKAEANCRIHDHLTKEVREEDQSAVLRDLARSAGVDHAAPGRDTLMTWDELRRIAAHPLVTIGAHTVHHYNLKRLDEDLARAELADSAEIIASKLGARPRHMAYPYGYASAVGPREVRLAREAGYVSAVTTRHGLLRGKHADNLQALPRISLNGRYQRIGHIKTMLSGITTPLANSGRLMVTV